MLWWLTLRSTLRAGRLAVALRMASLSGAFCSCFLCREGNRSRFHNPLATAQSFILLPKTPSSALSLVMPWINSASVSLQLQSSAGPVGLPHPQSLHPNMQGNSSTKRETDLSRRTWRPLSFCDTSTPSRPSGITPIKQNKRVKGNTPAPEAA